MPRRNWGSAVCPPRVLWGDRFVGHGVALCQSEGWPGMERGRGPTQSQQDVKLCMTVEKKQGVFHTDQDTLREKGKF